MTQIIHKFFAFCPKQYRRKFYLSIVLSILMAACRALRIPAIAIVLGAVMNGTRLDQSILAGFALLVCGVIAEGILKGAATDLQTQAGYGTACAKRIEIAEHMRYLPMGYFNRNSLGEITSVATNTMENLQRTATRAVMLICEGILTTMLIAAALLLYDARIGLVLVLGCLVYALVNAKLQKKSEEISAVKMKTDTVLVEHTLDYLQGLPEIKAYNLKEKNFRKLDQAIGQNVKANTDMEMTLIPYMTLQSIAAKLTGVSMAACSIALYLNGSMDLLTCIIMLIASFMVLGSMESAGNYAGLLRVVDQSIDRAQHILSMPAMDISGKEMKPASFALEAENISFSYDEKPVIRNLSAFMPAYSFTAVIGPSGSGKTTFAKLLARFWDVDEGAVMLGNMNAADYSMDCLMANYSFVFQNVFLFNDTIANNIRFGNPDAGMDQIIEAAEKAQCHEFIMNLPQGYETVIGENGRKLSGGERQRISIARAMMKKAPVVILDEATANVDPENELLLMKAIEELTRDRTVIMIAHRLRTVRKADQIFSIEQGRISERGTHEELMRKEGMYRKFILARQYAESWQL